MMSRLWVRHAMLLIGVSAVSVGIAFVGMSAFSLANEFVLEGYIPPQVEAELQALEAQAAPIMAELDAIYATWLTSGINYRRAGLMVSIAVVCLSFALIIAVFSARWITRPIDVLATQVRNLVAGDLGARNAEDRDLQAYGTEISTLMADMDRLAQTLEEREKRVRNDTAMIAHELRTPLTAIISHLHAMKDGIMEANADEITILMSQARALERVIDDMRTISLVDAGCLVLHREDFDLADVVTEAVNQNTRRFENANITLKAEPQSVVVSADRTRLLQVIRALLQNVLDHADGATHATIVCANEVGQATLTVKDNGAVLHPDFTADHLFEPFARLSNAAQNSGLGLAVIAAIAEAHEGEVRIDRSEGSGFQICFSIRRGNSRH